MSVSIWSDLTLAQTFLKPLLNIVNGRSFAKLSSQVVLTTLLLYGETLLIWGLSNFSPIVNRAHLILSL